MHAYVFMPCPAISECKAFPIKPARVFTIFMIDVTMKEINCKHNAKAQIYISTQFLYVQIKPTRTILICVLVTLLEFLPKIRYNVFFLVHFSRWVRLECSLTIFGRSSYMS